MLQDHQFRNFTIRALLCFLLCVMGSNRLIKSFWPALSFNLADHCWGLVTLALITDLSFPPSLSHLHLLLCISVSRETIRSKKKSDYNLNKSNAPILTNTTLNVIRLVGEFCTGIDISLTCLLECFALSGLPHHLFANQGSRAPWLAHLSVSRYLCDWAALIMVSLFPELWPFIS